MSMGEVVNGNETTRRQQRQQNVLTKTKSINLQEMGMGEVPNGNLDTTTALIYDSVTAFAIALNKLDTVQQVNDGEVC